MAQPGATLRSGLKEEADMKRDQNQGSSGDEFMGEDEERMNQTAKSGSSGTFGSGSGDMSQGNLGQNTDQMFNEVGGPARIDPAAAWTAI
jgi:hypothetical protein